jgi:hypothetical protein
MRFDAAGNILPVDVFEPVKAAKIRKPAAVKRR